MSDQPNQPVNPEPEEPSVLRFGNPFQPVPVREMPRDELDRLQRFHMY